MFAAQPATAQIDDILYRADGTRAAGTLVISWPAFITTDKQAVAAGSKTVSVSSDGRVVVALIPTVGGSPTGTVYKVVAKFVDGTTATEFWSVPTGPTATISQMRVAPATSGTSVVSQSLISGKLDRSGDTPTTLGGVRYASAFPGATVTNKLDTSIADCRGNPCVVVAPSFLGAGSPTTLPDNVVLKDERQWATMDAWGLPNLGQHNGVIWEKRITSTNDGWDGYSTGQFYFEAAKGGHNYWNGSTGAKNSYYALGTSTLSRTPGQILGTIFRSANYSSGDTVAGSFSTRRYGGTLTNGDEAQKIMRIDGGSGEVLFTAKVSAVSGNTITFSSSLFSYTLGETRMLINRNSTKQHTASCTVATSAAPPTITCSDANLSTWYSGTGNKSNVCFELDSAKVNEFNRTIRLRSIQSQTQATLDLTYQGWDAVWDHGSLGVPSTGKATFSYCSPVTDASQWNVQKVTVADASIFAAGDSIEQNVAPEQGFTGLSMLYYPSVWPSMRTTMLEMTNFGSKMDGTPTVPLYSYITTLGARTGAPATRFMWTHFNGTIGQGGLYWHNESTTPPGYAWFTAWSDNTTGCEPLVGTVNGTSNNFSMVSYCRDPSNPDLRGWRLNGLSVTEDGRIALSGLGFGPTAGRQFFLVSSANNDNFYSYEGTANSTGAAFKAANHSWVTGWQVDHSGNSKQFNGAKASWYSDAGSTPTASIDGSSGTAQFTKVCYDSARTLCDYAGTGAPSASCTTGSTYRRSDGSTNSTFYVCEAGQWSAK